MKNYEYYVSRRNTPRLDLYTWLIGLAYGSIALNAIITLLICSSFKDRFLTVESIFALVLLPLCVTDPRKSHRGLARVISDMILLTVLTTVHAFYYSFWKLFIVYTFEMLLGILIIKIKPWMFISKRRQKGNKKDVILKQENKRS